MFQPEIIHRSFRKETFRTSFSPYFWFLFPYTSAVVVLFNLSVYDVIPVGPIAGQLAAIALLVAVATEFMSRRYRSTVKPAGLESYDFLCQPQRAAWSEMVRATPIHALGLRYVRIVLTKGRPIWLPLDVRRESLMVDLIETHAGPGHPLVVALQSARSRHAIALAFGSRS